MVFRIYDDPDTGSLIWSESQTVTADSAGVFSAILGRVAPIPALSGPVWLEVEVDGEIMSPRRELASVPFAFQAMNADMLDGLGSGAFSDTNHAHDSRYYTQDSLSTEGILNDAANPVDWTKLKGVPGGLADGVDDVGGTGDGHSLDAADGIPVDAVYVDNEGHVGIGTSSPSKRLHITGDDGGLFVEAGSSDPEITLGDLGDDPADYWRLYKEAGTGEFRIMQDEDRLTIAYGSGHVGVGKTLPGAELDVAGSINLSEHIKIGLNAVLSIDGTSNTFVGEEAGINTTGPLGKRNTFLGSGSGFLNTSGFTNVFVGDSTGYGNTTGTGNVFVGSRSGFSNAGGGSNTFVGWEAGLLNDEADANTFVGSGAGFRTVDGAYNTFVGEGAGAFNEGGENNTYIGQAAGNWNATGSRNTCIGVWAGGGNHGDDNVFIGYRAGVDETGSSKLYIANGGDPEDVLIKGDFAAGRVGIGKDPLEAPLDVFRSMNVDSFYMVMGDTVLWTPMTNNTYVGIDAGGHPSWGGLQNTCVGKSAGQTVSNQFNTLIGSYAGQHVQGGEGNTAVGYVAGLLLNNGTSNTYIGKAAGYSGSGTWNVCLGASSGYWNNGDSNTFLGYSAGAVNYVGSGNVFVGHMAGFLETGSNKLYIANSQDTSDVLIYGDFSNGRIGLGTLSPERKLHIKGDNPRVLIEASSINPEINFKHAGDAGADVWALYKEGVSEDFRFYQNGDRMTIEGGTGNVGIGTTDPGAYKLYVAGNAYTTGSWQSSDLGLKKDISGIDSALEKVLGMRGVMFSWRAEEYPDLGLPEGRHNGVIAQEVERMLPEAVMDGPDGRKAVAYSEIIPVLIEAIKDQQSQIEALKARVAELEG